MVENTSVSKKMWIFFSSPDVSSWGEQKIPRFGPNEWWMSPQNYHSHDKAYHIIVGQENLLCFTDPSTCVTQTWYEITCNILLYSCSGANDTYSKCHIMGGREEEPRKDGRKLGSQGGVSSSLPSRREIRTLVALLLRYNDITYTILHDGNFIG